MAKWGLLKKICFPCKCIDIRFLGKILAVLNGLYVYRIKISRGTKHPFLFALPSFLSPWTEVSRPPAGSAWRSGHGAENCGAHVPLTLSHSSGSVQLTPPTPSSGVSSVPSWRQSSCVSELSLPPPGALSSPHPSIFQSAPSLCGPLLSPHTGGGHHGDAGAEAASLPVASLGHLWARVRAGGPLVPAVSDPCGAGRPSARTTSCSQGPRVGCPLAR